MEKLVIRRGVFFEGNRQGLRVIQPMPVISTASCEFINSKEVLFREDSFDPITRIRRGRLYVEDQRGEVWSREQVDYGYFQPQPGSGSGGYEWSSEASYKSWESSSSIPKEVIGHSIQIGSNGYITPWRIVAAERIAIGHILFTLRAYSQFGVIPELANMISDKEGNSIEIKPVRESLDALVDAIHRQQATPTVDVARETTRNILSTWIGQQAHGMDLAKAIELIPNDKVIAKWSASIINRLHPRGKSSEQERQEAKGSRLRPITEEDAECAVNLVGLLLREIGWTAQ